MRARRATAVVEDERFLEHRGPAGHPERPERLVAVHAAIAAREAELARLAPRPATDEEILRVHLPEHLARMAEAARRAPVHLDPDTYVAPASLEVARLAAGSAVELARRVARGELTAGLAAVRPPGHHAEVARAMGFCLINNVAVVARALQADEGLERILILDWDVHHGNGTQHVFEDDRDVLFVSTHQFPFYPGTGAVREAGRGAGVGATVNIPLPGGCGDADYVTAFQRVLVPVVRRFQPEIVLVSCGFDAHADDPLAEMELTGAGYEALTRIVRALADELCEGRLVFVLEGGYSPSGLEAGTAAVLDVLLREATPMPPASLPLPRQGPLPDLLERLRAVHGAQHPDLGAA
jgi:acetoin utilization deacetylase AcuC-like enzyme